MYQVSPYTAHSGIKHPDTCILHRSPVQQLISFQQLRYVPGCVSIAHGNVRPSSQAVVTGAVFPPFTWLSSFLESLFIATNTGPESHVM